MRLVNDDNRIDPEQARLSRPCRPARAVAAEQEPTAPHVRRRADHRTGAGIVDPTFVRGETATQIGQDDGW